MKKSILALSIILLSSMVTIIDIKASSQTGGFSISYPIFEDGVFVDIRETNVFSSEEVYFNVGNTDSIPLNITASAEVLYLENWQDNFSISFNQPFKVLQPNETFKFIPSIMFNIELANNYSIHFVFRALTDANGTVTVVKAHGQQVNFRLITDLIGHSLTIRTTDQGDWERRSNIKIWYGGTGDQGKGWTIYKELRNTASFSSIVLEGWYQITSRIYDNSTDELTEYVNVNQTTKLNIVYKLVTMQITIPNLPTSYRDPLNFTYFITNDYVSLQNVEIVFQLFRRSENNSEILTAVTDPIIEAKNNFAKGTFTSATLSFGGGWTAGDHVFIGTIYVDNQLYFQIKQDLIFAFDWYEEFERSDLFLPLLIIITMLSSVGLTLVAIYIFYRYNKKREITNQIIEKKENEQIT